MHTFNSLMSDPISFLIEKLLTLPAILIALTVHEICHGYAAYKCGDPTARMTGRLSFNPLRHLDPAGFLLLLFFGFGYAKPVLINPRNFRKPRRDTAIVSLAGPLSNLLMAFFAVLVFQLYYIFGIPALLSANTQFALNFATAVYNFLLAFCTINLGLFVFNMIPLPPLDGSKVLLSILPQKVSFKVRRYEQYSQILLFVLLFLGAFSGFISNAIYTILYWFIDFWALILGGLL